MRHVSGADAVTEGRRTSAGPPVTIPMPWQLTLASPHRIDPGLRRPGRGLRRRRRTKIIAPPTILRPHRRQRLHRPAARRARLQSRHFTTVRKAVVRQHRLRITHRTRNRFDVRRQLIAAAGATAHPAAHNQLAAFGVHHALRVIRLPMRRSLALAHQTAAPLIDPKTIQ